MNEAKKMTACAPTLASWGEVDEALRLLGECENCIAEIKADHDRKEAVLKSQSALQITPYQEKIKVQAQLIQEFAKAHKAELDGKTKLLTHGKTGYRSSSQCVIPRGAEPDIILALRAKDMLECIAVKESVNRDALKQYSAAEIKEVGAKITTSNRFWCEATHVNFSKT